MSGLASADGLPSARELRVLGRLVVANEAVRSGTLLECALVVPRDFAPKLTEFCGLAVLRVDGLEGPMLGISPMGR